MNNKPNIKDFQPENLQVYLKKNGEKPFRQKQIFNQIFCRRKESFAEMHTLPPQLREKLDDDFTINSLEIKRVSHSRDMSSKYLFEAMDGQMIEATLMPDKKGKRTLCVSTMAGCPVGCKFCATGYLGFKRNLTTAEIVDQVYLVEKYAESNITNVVYMGMGEPLLNFDNTMKSIGLLTLEECPAVSRRRITVSSFGVAEKINKMAESRRFLKLAISLHGTTDTQRRMLIPAAKSQKIKDLIDSIENYYKATKSKITLEYILFSGINDLPEDARRLAKINKRFPIRVNIIPFNDISFIAKNTQLKPSNRTNEFSNILKDYGITVVIRRTYGKDIEAACGQLALSEQLKKP